MTYWKTGGAFLSFQAGGKAADKEKSINKSISRQSWDVYQVGIIHCRSVKGI